MDKWEREGARMVTEKTWVKMCVKIAEKDVDRLGSILDVAKVTERKMDAADTPVVQPAPWLQ